MARRKAAGWKSRVNFFHARRRAWQRYGIDLTREKHRRAILQIQRGEHVQFVERRSNARSTFDIWIDGRMARVVYDRVHHCLVTFLPNPYR